MFVFENNGIVPLEAFTTFGVNAKPNSTNPIGYFGTGLKYAVAVTLRLGGEFRLYRGHEEYVFYVKDTDFRGKNFSMIRMKRRHQLMKWRYSKLPFTTELGKDWKPWMAVRELESNCRDENGWSFIGQPDTDLPLPEQTRIMIHCPDMELAFRNLHQIFMPEWELLTTEGNIQVYRGQSDFIFYRGLRVMKLSKPSLFTYNYTDGFDLTEDRTAKYEFWIHTEISHMIQSTTVMEIPETVMDKGKDMYEGTLPYDQPNRTPSSTYLGLLGSRVTSGKAVLPRMKTYYDSLYVDAEDEMVSVSMRRKEWRNVLECDLPPSAKSKIQSAVGDKEAAEDVPF